MCKNQLSLYNPSLHYQYAVDPVWVNVPCGKCDECINQAQKDWFIRLYAEFLDVQESNGSCYMFTLTYAKCPTLKSLLSSDALFVLTNTCPSLSNYLDSPLFNKDHIKVFINSLRHRFVRRFGSDYRLRYFIASEFGEEKKRPHYHLILFLPNKKLYPSVVNDIVKSLWHHGFVMLSRDKKSGSGYITNIKALNYVSKYVTKDLSFYDLPYVKDIVNLLKSCDESIKFVRKFLPFHLQSRYFGFRLFDMFESFLLDSPDGDYSEFCDAIYNGISYMDGSKLKHTRIPLYIKNKFFYDVRPDGSRYLNNLGVLYNEYTFNVRSKKLGATIHYLIDNASTILSSSDYKYFLSFKSKYSDVYYCSEQFFNLCGAYVLALRHKIGYCTSFNVFDYDNAFNYMSDKYLSDLVQRSFLHCPVRNVNGSYLDDSLNISRYGDKPYGFYPNFIVFEEFLSMYKCINNVLMSSSNDKIKHIRELNKIRELFNTQKVTLYDGSSINFNSKFIL